MSEKPSTFSSKPPTQDGLPALLTSTGRWVDLSHDFSDETLYWPTQEGFVLEPLEGGDTSAGYYVLTHRFRASEHGGTHIDAPAHLVPGGRTVDRISLGRLCGPGAVVDVSAKARADPDYEVIPDDLAAWERVHGTVAPGAILLFHTGHGRHWPDAVRYLGTAERGATGVPSLHFPGLSTEAARLLAEEREISAVGLDSPGVDGARSRLRFGRPEAHRIILGHGIPILENVANLERLPATGSLILALPMKIRGGSGAPLRIVAWVPR